MTSFSKQLLLVGQGPWSTKIASAVERENPGIQFEVISARALLLNEYLIKESAFRYIWLCVRPNMQSQVLKHLSRLESTFILEKPFAVTQNGFMGIRQSKAYMDGRVRQSRVWRYSPVWQHFIANTPNEITKIEINRGGPPRNSVLPLPEDWISHDLYLLTDLFGGNVLPLEVKKASYIEEKFNCSLFLGSVNVMVNMSIGKFEERCANWTVYREGETSRIDFLTSTIQKSEDKNILKIEGQDAIYAMLRDLEDFKKESLDLDWDLQRKFITEVMTNAR